MREIASYCWEVYPPFFVLNAAHFASTRTQFLPLYLHPAHINTCTPEKIPHPTLLTHSAFFFSSSSSICVCTKEIMPLCVGVVCAVWCPPANNCHLAPTVLHCAVLYVFYALGKGQKLRLNLHQIHHHMWEWWQHLRGQKHKNKAKNKNNIFFVKL